ncbi:DUF596 domain-containing protein [Klebsiella oxytoca]|uniref:DUF596 domain-containing protein n=1 Tax=Klebsiella oxytoca TaxID=571 RepID=UPI0020C52BD2|nr:DUF596 domain-containing protein [Klebsiella oxytoca]
MIKITIPDELYKERLDTLEGMAIDALWGVSCPNEDIYNMEFPFEKQKAYFLLFLMYFLESGKIKLGKHGQFLEGTIEEQINRYRAAFPETEEEWVRRNEEIWFYEEDCPGGIVWIGDDDSEDWT